MGALALLPWRRRGDAKAQWHCQRTFRADGTGQCGWQRGTRANQAAGTAHRGPRLRLRQGGPSLPCSLSGAARPRSPSSCAAVGPRATDNAAARRRRCAATWAAHRAGSRSRAKARCRSSRPGFPSPACNSPVLSNRLLHPRSFVLGEEHHVPLWMPLYYSHKTHCGRFEGDCRGKTSSNAVLPKVACHPQRWAACARLASWTVLTAESRVSRPSAFAGAASA